MVLPMNASTRMPRAWDVECYACGARDRVPMPMEPARCSRCGTPMGLSPSVPSPADLFDQDPRSMWDYASLLPVRDPAGVVTLGEGATPLVPAPRLGRRLGLAELRVKNEAANPTGSFKDRQVSVGVSCAREAGYRVAAVVSSGNVGVATAAYCARAGMRAVLFMHAHAGAGKIAQAAACGARVFRVACPSPDRVFTLCREACARFGWAHLSTAGIYAPANVEGARTIAYELWRQYDGRLPDWIVVPVGGEACWEASGAGCSTCDARERSIGCPGWPGFRPPGAPPWSGPCARDGRRSRPCPARGLTRKPLPEA